MFFNNWYTLVRVLIIGTLAYAVLVIALRISGKRTLAQLNAFDFVVTVAFGSTLASTILSTNVAFLDGAVALILLVSLQLVVAWLSVRIPPFSRMVKSEPRLLYHQGEFRWATMRQERIKKEEVLQSVRSQGISSMSNVESIVLETNGNMSVISTSGQTDHSVLENVVGD